MLSRGLIAAVALCVCAALSAAATTTTPAPATKPATTSASTAAASDLFNEGWTVVFRSDDPAIWNSSAGDPSVENGYAIPLDQTPADMRFLRLKRLDTGDAVIAQVTRDQFGKPSLLDGDVQWRPATPPKGTEPTNNRSLMGFVRRSWPAEQNNEHLIIFSRNWKGYRGWGFSKRVGTDEAQTYSWAGNPIEKAIFEVAVKSGDLTEDERKLLITDEAKIAARLADVKAVARRQTSIHGLTVTFTDTGVMLGGTTDLILTATPGSARADTPVVFVRPVGDQMKLVLDDVLRCVRLKYPRWEAEKVDITFDDRTSKLDGASIGAVCGTMLLSMLEGFEIDGKLAMTGDVTADGKVRRIGGVAARIRAATNSNCAIVALPADNYDQVADALVYEGPQLLSKIQLIGIATLDDATAVARVDRADNLKRAIELFAEVQTALAKSPEQIKTKAVRDRLAEIVDLAPNHHSAKLLMAVATDKQPRRLSSGATLYYMALAIEGVVPALKELTKATDRQTVTPVAIKDGIRTLDRIRRIADPPLIPLLDSYRDFLRGVADAQAGTIPVNALKARIKAVEDAEAKVKVNRDVMEKMLREGV